MTTMYKGIHIQSDNDTEYIQDEPKLTVSSMLHAPSIEDDKMEEKKEQTVDNITLTPLSVSTLPLSASSSESRLASTGLIESIVGVSDSETQVLVPIIESKEAYNLFVKFIQKLTDSLYFDNASDNQLQYIKLYTKLRTYRFCNIMFFHVINMKEMEQNLRQEIRNARLALNKEEYKQCEEWLLKHCECFTINNIQC